MAVRVDSDERRPSQEVVPPGAVTALLAKLAAGATLAPMPLLAPGVRVGRYEVIRTIGRGGFGCVYEAHDAELHRLVALKVLQPSRASAPDAVTEGEAAARLAHPNIAALYDAGTFDGAPYLVYELLLGETLESRLARGPLRVADALAIATGIAAALAHAHAHGVVHRDLKPGNVFLTADGDVKVLDFGVALLFGRGGASGGTPAYMAPEQRRGEPEDARTDLYALGVVLREMVTGERQRQGVGSAARTPPPVRRVLASLLAEDPAARPRSARSALAALDGARRAAVRPGRILRRSLLVSAAAVALFASVGTTLLLRRGDPEPRGAERTGALPSIAVMPFKDLSPGKDHEYFSDGLAEEILNALTRLEGVHVAGRTSSFSFKGKSDDVAAIAARLQVKSLLEGSVRRSGDRVRITAQLVDAGSGYHLWSQTYDRELTDVLAVQDDIARSVVDALRVKLIPSAPRRQRVSADAEAYDQYLVGRELRRRPAPGTWRRAVAAFERAVALDPGFAPAWAELANAWFWHGNELSRLAEIDDSKRRAAAAADRALALDPELGDGYAVRGMLRASVRRWSEALADLDRALALNPGSADAHWWRGRLLLDLGRYDAALADMRRVSELDPLWPLAWGGVGEVLLALGHTAEARRMFERAVELNPDADIGRHLIVLTLVLEGRPAEALPLLDRPRSVWRAQDEVLVHHALGDAARAQRALDALIAENAEAAAFQIAEIYAWRGERDRAFEWLDRAFAQRDAGFNELRFSPLLVGVMDDPRFDALVSKLNQPRE